MRRRSRVRGWTMTDDAVSVWCFAGKDMWALTDDDSGHALPAERPQGTRSELRVLRKGEGPILASWPAPAPSTRSEEHTSELQSLMRISYAVFCLKKKKHSSQRSHTEPDQHTQE